MSKLLTGSVNWRRRHLSLALFCTFLLVGCGLANATLDGGDSDDEYEDEPAPPPKTIPTKKSVPVHHHHVHLHKKTVIVETTTKTPGPGPNAADDYYDYQDGIRAADMVDMETTISPEPTSLAPTIADKLTTTTMQPAADSKDALGQKFLVPISKKDDEDTSDYYDDYDDEPETKAKPASTSPSSSVLKESQEEKANVSTASSPKPYFKLGAPVYFAKQNPDENGNGTTTSAPVPETSSVVVTN